MREILTTRRPFTRVSCFCSKISWTQRGRRCRGNDGGWWWGGGGWGRGEGGYPRGYCKTFVIQYFMLSVYSGRAWLFFDDFCIRPKSPPKLNDSSLSPLTVLEGVPQRLPQVSIQRVSRSLSQLSVQRVSRWVPQLLVQIVPKRVPIWLSQLSVQKALKRVPK